MLYVLSEGCSWRAIDRPEARWNSVYQYHRRWCRNGLWAQLLRQLGEEATGTLRFLDSSHVKVHAHGANPQGGQQAQAMGRTKGGLNTKIHAVVDNRGRPVAVVLTAGQASDVAVAPMLLRSVSAGCCLIADKAYDTNAFRALLAHIGARACIPSLSRRLKEIPYAKATYKKRHRVENFFQKLKRYRRIATRYDKLAETYFGFLLLTILVVALSH